MNSVETIGPEWIRSARDRQEYIRTQWEGLGIREIEPHGW
jgi:hypothetical protein